MRVTSALILLAVCISLGACSRPSEPAHAKPRASPLPHPTKVTSVKSRPLPARKSAEPKKVIAVKPALPTKKPPQGPNATAEAKFKAAQDKAARVGIENLSQEDIEGLTSSQLKKLRGY